MSKGHKVVRRCWFPGYVDSTGSSIAAACCLCEYLVEGELEVVSRGPVDGHGGVQQPAQRGALDAAQLLLVLGQVLAVHRRHQAAAAEQVGEGRERAFADLEKNWG